MLRSAKVNAFTETENVVYTDGSFILKVTYKKC